MLRVSRMIRSCSRSMDLISTRRQRHLSSCRQIRITRSCLIMRSCWLRSSRSVIRWSLRLWRYVIILIRIKWSIWEIFRMISSILWKLLSFWRSIIRARWKDSYPLPNEQDLELSITSRRIAVLWQDLRKTRCNEDYSQSTRQAVRQRDNLNLLV